MRHLFYPVSQWKDAKPEDLMDSKLRCVFELPSENDKMVSSATLSLSFNSLSNQQKDDI